MSQTLSWAILGTGNIARQFAEGARCAARARLCAAGSRSAAAAEAFAREYGIAAAYGSYEQAINDPAVGAVYVALPNSEHYRWTLAALRAGKHVLCEKPLALDAAQAEEMFDAAQRAGRVLVEAFMYRAHPQTAQVLHAVRSGAIGSVRMIRTSFCYRTTRIGDNIRFARQLGGGALMDVGCYCTDFARLIAGAEPLAVRASAHMHETGVDDLTAAVLEFPGGILATMTCGMLVHAGNAAHICGSEGYIDIPVPWKPQPPRSTFTIARSTPPRMDRAAGAGSGPSVETRTVEAPANLYAMEADAFAAAALDGATPHVSPRDSLGNMRVLDEIRRQTGLRF